MCDRLTTIQMRCSVCAEILIKNFLRGVVKLQRLSCGPFCLPPSQQPFFLSLFFVEECNVRTGCCDRRMDGTESNQDMARKRLKNSVASCVPKCTHILGHLPFFLSFFLGRTVSDNFTPISHVKGMSITSLHPRVEKKKFPHIHLPKWLTHEPFSSRAYSYENKLFRKWRHKNETYA